MQPAPIMQTREGARLRAIREGAAWRHWGPYLSDRQWGTVREDYSAKGDAWTYLTHDDARSRAYRWGEDAIAGFGDEKLRWCLGLALWNGRDAILKERLFGLNNSEGNHGEDVKELYYYLDATPTHSYLRMLYKYPQGAYPYERLVAENARRGQHDPEFELIDTGLFDEQRYFDVFVEYAKADPEDILMRVRVINRGPDTASLSVLPQIWARNDWSWEHDATRAVMHADGDRQVLLSHPRTAPLRVSVEASDTLLFCENETNVARLYGERTSGYFKDGINDYLVGGQQHAVNPERTGSKCAALHMLSLSAGEERVLRLRLRPESATGDAFADFDAIFKQRMEEADEFYAALQIGNDDADVRLVQRQAFAGMIWSKQLYDYDVRLWLEGDPAGPKPPPGRGGIRNGDWQHVHASEIISMPDKWEYPWFASWDLALQCPVLALVDPDFAKGQLLLLTREWYTHPNAALPAYEWSFSDANPPLHAWSAWRVFEIDRALNNAPDHHFLKRIFNKLTMNFTWWVNRKDASGRNIFQGGFLGLDNIAIFDRSSPLPTGGELSQSDGTAWMAMYALQMLRISVEIALQDSAFEDVAAKFFEHFLLIASAEGNSLWDEQDQFFYDQLGFADGRRIPLRARSMVGLIPVFATAVLQGSEVDRLPQLKAQMTWFLKNRPDLAQLVSHWTVPGHGDSVLISLLRTHRLTAILDRVLDETEFLAPGGVRAVSKFHEQHPYRLEWESQCFELNYWPGESESRLFGGNSNWRGPIWMPVNYLLIESLLRHHRYYGDTLTVEFPRGSGRQANLHDVASELSRRLVSLFTRGADGRRPVHGDYPLLQQDPHFRDLVLFYEYFHGDNGRGVGASHQTGWSGLVASLIHRLAGYDYSHWDGPRAEATGGKPADPSGRFM
ncbi:MGH1-like glycoside hydrolase domain-containing protein [Lichenicoccus roseus]|uniref:MGH1-like glycoside hydrolase domain-containing protein n=1 Tax=Lichenicoccus roseus TaxID=2683649 RepID=UPI00197F7A98|nr:glucosidase [Lichenicoccus roseus]